MTALLRNSTLAGSMNTDVNGRMLWATSQLTASPSRSITHRSGGASTNMPRIAMIAPRMPAEKLSTSISNPGLILPAHRASTRFITSAVSGPMIIAPRNIGEPVRPLPRKIGSEVAMITPSTAKPPTTPPRTPYTIRPPVKAMRTGST